MVKFALVGVVNTAVDVGLFWVLQAVLGVPYLIANVISYSAGTLNSFVLNKVWTFAETRHGGVVRQQLPLFFAINVASLALSSLVLWALAGLIGVMPAKLVAVVVSFVWNFVASRTLVFAPKAGREPAEPRERPGDA